MHRDVAAGLPARARFRTYRRRRCAQLRRASHDRCLTPCALLRQCLAGERRRRLAFRGSSPGGNELSHHCRVTPHHTRVATWSDCRDGLCGREHDRLRVLSLVAQNELHHPALLAKDIATIDTLSGGRVELGIGTGWLPDDYAKIGLTIGKPSARVARLAEGLQIIRHYFTKKRVDFEGKYYRVDDMEALPRCVQQPSSADSDWCRQSTNAGSGWADGRHRRDTRSNG